MKTIKLTESDLNRIVKKVINEDTTNPNYANLANMLEKAMKGGGTDLEAIKIVFDQINNKQDYLNLKKSFGMRAGQDLETWIGQDIWSGRDWDTYVKPFYEKIGVKISPVNSELQKVSDKVSSMFNESDLNRIVKKVLTEQDNVNYMFFSNLEQIKRQCEMMLEMDQDQLDMIIQNGHDWADDHISEAKNNIDQVFDFFKNETDKESQYVDYEDMNEGRKKTGTPLCARGLAAAKGKFKVHPSAYSNGYGVQVCKGKMPGLDGKKHCSGAYC